MLSQATFAQIAQVTEEALQQITTRDAIHRVTIIRGYAQLLALDPSHKEYGEKLVNALLALYNVASRLHQAELAQNLQALVEVINGERTP